MEENFSEICLKCMKCCKGEGFVFLKESEIKQISDFLGIKPEVFLEKFCENKMGRVVLKSKPNSECIFLTKSGCKIYPVRPEQCKTFPFKWKYPGAESECLLLRLKLVSPVDSNSDS